MFKSPCETSFRFCYQVVYNVVMNVDDNNDNDKLVTTKKLNM